VRLTVLGLKNRDALEERVLQLKKFDLTRWFYATKDLVPESL